MIEKIDMLHASYQVNPTLSLSPSCFLFEHFFKDIRMTMNHSNEQFNDLQRQLLLTIEVENFVIELLLFMSREILEKE